MNKKSANPVDAHVGGRIRMRRMILNMTQEKLGDALGLTFQQVQKYEKGTNRVGASRLQQISNIMHVPPAYFFEGAPTLGGKGNHGDAGPSPAFITEFLSTADGLAMVRAMHKIKDKKLIRRVVDLVEHLAK